MRILRGIGILFVSIIALLALIALGARFRDGPVGLFPGGALESGPLQEGAVPDWNFAVDEETIELQLLSQELSRTTWILVRDGAAFIPCSVGFPPGKSWHHRAEQDGRAVIRIDGRRYPVHLARVENAVTLAALGEIVTTKYGGGPPSDAGVWYFRVTSRAP
jgi:hypothetical protein